jgi:hypothetical protein
MTTLIPKFDLMNGSTTPTGAVNRAINLKLAESISILDFGGVGDGATDNATALQNAHNALPTNGGIIYFPASANSYLINTAVTFTKPVTLIGNGWYSSQISTSTNTLNLISSNTRLNVQGFSFVATGSAIGTCNFLCYTTPSTTANHSTVENNYFNNANISIYNLSTTAINIVNNQFYSLGQSIYLANLVNSDQGDSFISNNTIAGGSSATGIFVSSSSGLYITNNKFLNENIHIALEPSNKSIGDFLINNNSFEGHTNSAITAFATSGGNIVKTLITGNQFSSTNPPAQHIYLGLNVQETIITGNYFSTNSSQGVGINIDTGSRHTSIVGNQFYQILQCILAASNTDLGLTLNGNRFNTDSTSGQPTVYFSGDNGSASTPMGMDKQITACRYITNSTPSTYTDVFKIQANGTVEVNAYGVVQGVSSSSSIYTKVICSASYPTNIISPVSSGGQFDLQLVSSGGYLVVSVRQHTGVGTGINVWVQVTVNGDVNYFGLP